MLEFLRTSKDDYATADLVGKVSELAEKYPFNTSVQMLKPVFLMSPVRFSCVGFKYSIVWFPIVFVHMPLITNGSLRP